MSSKNSEKDGVEKKQKISEQIGEDIDDDVFEFGEQVDLEEFINEFKEFTIANFEYIKQEIENIEDTGEEKDE